MARAPTRFPTHGPELRALLTACHREPDDDTPRLVLADWLEERDDPRGELVRLQVRLAAMPAGDGEYDALFERHQKWWRKYGRMWAKEAGGSAVEDVLWDPGPHDRGLPTVGHYDSHACEFESFHFQEAPLGRLPAVVADGWPGMTWVLPAGLRAESEWDEADDFDDEDDDMSAAYDPETDTFTEPPRDDPFDTFRQPPWKGSPTPVGVRFPREMIADAGHITQVARVPNLRGLALCESRPSPSLLPHVAKIKGLEHLDLNDMRLDDAGVRRLAPLKKLRTLAARGAAITDAGAAQLAKFTELRELRLGTRRLTAAGYQALAKLSKLEVLELAKADDAAIRHLAPLSRLRRLELAGTKVTGRGVENFPLLTYLELPTTQLNDAGFASVAALPRLRYLNVAGTRITGAALQHLSGLRWLEDLLADKSEIRDKDLVHLEPLKNLRLLTLWETHVTNKGRSLLQKKLRSASIQR